MSTPTVLFLTLAQLLQQNPEFKPPKKMEIALHSRCGKIDASTPRYTVEVASTPTEMEVGLSRRPTPLAPGEGMLFWVQPSKPTVFWMKDTWIPLEILYFNDSGVLLNHHSMAVEQNPSKPEVTYASRGPARLALEIAPLKGKAKSIPEGLQICFGKVH